MKKIGIDARLLTQTGVGIYLENLLYHLDNQKIKNETFYVYLREIDKDKIKFKNKNIIKKIANQKWHSLSEQTSFLSQLIKDDLDLMHFTYFSYPILYWRKFVATVHDTTPLLFKTGKASTKNQLIYWLKHNIFKIVLWCQVSMSKKIITPTFSVRDELIKIYGGKITDKIIPIYEGVNQKMLEIKENKNLEKKYKDFFIYVGNFYPHKNVEKLIDAFSTISNSFKLILIGPDDYFTLRMIQYIKQSEARNKVTLIKSPTLSDLIFFYKNALAIIHPSLSEGFGLPLIEAAYFNTPIIASNIPVFKELWKDKYVSFNPKDVNDIMAKIKEFIIKRLKFDYKNILKNYSFEKMTQETLKIYQSITQNS